MNDPKCFEKPNDHTNHDHNIKNGFDFVIHWNIRIDKPQDYACNNKND